MSKGNLRIKSGRPGRSAVVTNTTPIGGGTRCGAPEAQAFVEALWTVAATSWHRSSRDPDCGELSNRGLQYTTLTGAVYDYGELRASDHRGVQGRRLRTTCVRGKQQAPHDRGVIPIGWGSWPPTWRSTALGKPRPTSVRSRSTQTDRSPRGRPRRRKVRGTRTRFRDGDLESSGAHRAHPADPVRHAWFPAGWHRRLASLQVGGERPARAEHATRGEGQTGSRTT